MAETWDIELDGFDALMRALVTLYPEVVADETYKLMEMSLAAFHQAVVVETPVGVSGNLRSAMMIDIVSGPVEMVGSVMNPLIYAWPVEMGRRPGRMPPVEAIELWVIRKQLNWTYKTKSGAVRPMTTHQMAYVIARAIGRGDTRFQKAGGARMFQKGFDAALPAVERLWDTLPDRIVKRLE